jgi:hypothetical protein
MTLTVLIMSRHTHVRPWPAEAIVSLGHVLLPTWRASEPLHSAQMVRLHIAIVDTFGLPGRPRCEPTVRMCSGFRVRDMESGEDDER